MNGNNIYELMDLIKPQLERIEAYIRDNERARNLRPEIIERFLGLLLTDDERARLLGLPNGCRIRETAKIICPKTRMW